MTKREVELLETIEGYERRTNDEKQLEYIEKWWKAKEEKAEKRKEKRRLIKKYFKAAIAYFEVAIRYLGMAIILCFKSINRY